MGKRKKEKSDDEIKRKIQRLEKELNRRKKPPGDNGDVDCDAYSECEELGVQSEAYPETNFSEIDAECIESLTPPTPAKVLSEIHQTASPSQHDEDTIPTEILAILGMPKNSDEIFGANIPKEIAERWGKILVDGLQKEQKENLLSKMLVPANFQMSKAPKLNAEVSAVLNEPMKNRDKRLEKMQNQLGSGIAGLANLTASLINQQDIDKMDTIKRISEVNQILLDLHYEESMNRRRLIIPMLDKSFINMIQGVKREKFLFGDNLCDNIKSTKQIEKSSLQIKKPVQQPSTTRRPTTSAPQGNSRVPPRHASGPGAARAPLAPTRYYQPPPPPVTAARRQPPGPRRPPPPPPGHPQERRGRR